jgi:hypothetical protein
MKSCGGDVWRSARFQAEAAVRLRSAEELDTALSLDGLTLRAPERHRR